MAIRFDPVTLATDRYRLGHAQRPVAVEPRVIDPLLCQTGIRDRCLGRGQLPEIPRRGGLHAHAVPDSVGGVGPIQVCPA